MSHDDGRFPDESRDRREQADYDPIEANVDMPFERTEELLASMEDLT